MKKGSKVKKSAAAAVNGHMSGEGDAQDDDEGASLDSLPPKQDLNERRRIRQEYRKLTDSIKDNSLDLVNPGNDDLQAKLTETDDIFQQVQMTREAAMDSSTLVLISQLGKQKAQKLTTDFFVFQPTEFADKLVAFISGESAEHRTSSRVVKAGWETLGKAVLTLFHRSPALHFMYGAFEADEPKVKAKPKKVRVKDKDKNVAEQKPKMISTSAMNQTEQTTEEVEKVHDKLNEIHRKYKGPVCLFEFVTNPFSFGQTVENIFHVSFLVRDGHVRVYLDDDRLPVIEPVTADVAERRDRATMDKTMQVVLSITEDDWTHIINVFEIQQPLIPHREKMDTDNNEVEEEEEEEEEENIEPSSSKPRPSKRKTSANRNGRR